MWYCCSTVHAKCHVVSILKYFWGLGPGLVLFPTPSVLVKAANTACTVCTTSRLSQLQDLGVLTKYYVLVVNDPAFIPKHPLFLVLEPLQDQRNISTRHVLFVFVCVCVCMIHKLTTMVRMKPVLKRATGSPMATLMVMDMGQIPQSAGQLRQFSSSSQMSSPHTETQILKVYHSTFTVEVPFFFFYF